MTFDGERWYKNTEKYARLLKRGFENAIFRVSMILLNVCDCRVQKFDGVLIL